MCSRQHTILKLHSPSSIVLLHYYTIALQPKHFLESTVTWPKLLRIIPETVAQANNLIMAQELPFFCSEKNQANTLDSGDWLEHC